MKAELLIAPELQSLTDEQLDADVTQWLGRHDESIYGLAKSIAECIRRGFNIAERYPQLAKRGRWIDVVKKIATGQIYSLLAEQYMEWPVFDNLKRLPLDDQKRIAESGMVLMCVWNERTQSYEQASVPVVGLVKAQRELVFCRDRLRSFEEQLARLRAAAPPIESDATDCPCTFSCTADERRAIRRKAKARGETDAELLRAIFVAGCKSLRVQ